MAAGLARRAETGRGPAPSTAPQLEQLCGRPDLALRERTLWRLLHESGAPVKAVLALNVEDLDLADRRARRRPALDRPPARPGCCRNSRPAGPAARCSSPIGVPGPPGGEEADLCPETGRRRLSYERAEYLFKQATGGTLRQLSGAGLCVREAQSCPDKAVGAAHEHGRSWTEIGDAAGCTNDSARKQWGP